MADRAICREASRPVIRIRRGVEVLGMTRRAIRRRPGVLPSDVALYALQPRVHTGQRKPGKGRVVKFRCIPRCGCVAHGTVAGESSLCVIRVRRAVIVLRMAAVTCHRRAFGEPVHVARSAVDRGVHACQRKAGKLRVIK